MLLPTLPLLYIGTYPDTKAMVRALIINIRQNQKEVFVVINLVKKVLVGTLFLS